jgi:DNA-binding CsgD family transcriptional regulator/PAS domain-containing protein
MGNDDFMVTVSNEVLSSIIGDIYDCSLNPDRWTAALTRITHEFGAAYTAISLTDPNRIESEGRMAAFSPWDPMRLRELNETYGVDGVPGLREVAYGDVDVPQSTLSQMTEADFQTSDFYQHWAKPQGLREACVTKFVHTSDRMGIMAQITRSSRPMISAEDRRFIALLSPHVRRACMIGDLLDHQRVAGNAYRTTLNSLTIPILLTDCDQKIIYANATAEELLKAGTIIASRAGKLCSIVPMAHHALADSVSRTINAGQALGRRGMGIPISAPGEAPAIAYVLPLAGSAERSVFGEATAAVFISTTTAASPPPEAALVALFDLTPAEARLMCKFGDGIDTATIAAELNVSANTLKSHLKNIYSKTKTTRQQELTQLVNALTPALQL